MRKKPKGPCFRLGEQPGEGKAGRVNASKPLMMPRHCKLGMTG